MSQLPRLRDLKQTRDRLALLKGLIEAGKVTQVIDRTYPLDEVPAAIRYLEESHARGKVVITVCEARTAHAAYQRSSSASTRGSSERLKCAAAGTTSTVPARVPAALSARAGCGYGLPQSSSALMPSCSSTSRR